MQVKFVEIGYYNPTIIELIYSKDEKIIYTTSHQGIKYIVDKIERIIANTCSFDYTRVKYTASKRLLKAMKQKPETEGNKSVFELLVEQGIEVREE